MKTIVLRKGDAQYLVVNPEIGLLKSLCILLVSVGTLALQIFF